TAQRLSPRAGAGIAHALSRPRLAGERDQLAALVLDLEQARLERAQREDIRAPGEGDAPRREPGRLDAGAFRPKRGEQLVAGVLEQIRAHRERSALVQRRREGAGFCGADLLAPELRQP